MAIAYDTGDQKYTGGSATSTFNLAASASGSIAVIMVFNGNGAPLSGVTVGGSAATLIRSYNIAGSQYLSAWYYVNPPTSSVAYTATATNANDDVEICALIYSGAKQTGQPDSSNQGTSATPLTLSTTTVEDNCWLVACARNTGSGAPSPSTGSTTRKGTPTVTPVLYADSNGAKTPAGVHSMAFTSGGGTNYGIVVSISPSTTPPVVANDTIMFGHFA